VLLVLLGHAFVTEAHRWLGEVLFVLGPHAGARGDVAQ
jgi:hypothetical protein